MPSRNPQPIDAAVVPRFAGIASFMRLPHEPDASKLDIALVGVPWDGGTTNRPGARHGPREIRSQSSLIRRVHPVSLTSPYDTCRIGDVGDAPVNPIDLKDSLKQIEGFFRKIRSDGAVPVSAGGDHLITLPILRALATEPVGLIQFDSHSDTNDRYFGDNPYTHGTPFRRAIEEGLIDAKRSIQVGIRGSLYDPGDLDYARDAGIRIVTIEEFFDLGVAAVTNEIRRVAGGGPVYVTFDVDSLDPVYAPGTGTPEIGGFSSHDAQRMIRGLHGLDIIGADVVEVSPPFDLGGATALLGASLMFELLCVLADRIGSRNDG